MIQTKRVYEPAKPADGARFLVERLWPRGVKKTALKMDGWLRDVAPSTALRNWFHHDPKRWPEFRARYFRELGANSTGYEPIIRAVREKPVTLLYSARDTRHNGALVLKEFLERKLGRKRTASSKARAKRAR